MEIVDESGSTDPTGEEEGMTIDEMKHWIDTADYAALLTKWRFALSGDPFFHGEVGDHFEKVMAESRLLLGDAEHTRVSKEIGWER